MNRNFVNLKKTALYLLIPICLYACHKIQQQAQPQNQQQHTELPQAKQSKNNKYACNQTIKKKTQKKSKQQSDTAYTEAEDSVKLNLFDLGNLADTNDMLYQQAFDEYRTRIGKKFQLSVFFNKSEVNSIQNMLLNIGELNFLDSCSYKRIMSGCASLCDIEPFANYLNYEMIHDKFADKIEPIYEEIVKNNDTSYCETLYFGNKKTQEAFQKERHLIDEAWGSKHVENMVKNLIIERDSKKSQTDTVINQKIESKYDSLQKQVMINFEQENGKIDAPNFSIPEFKKIRSEYEKNMHTVDSLYQIMLNDSIQHTL